MASIAGQLWMDLGAISNAVGAGQITRESRGNTSAVKGDGKVRRERRRL
ncbi:MAG: hypothetical protein ABSD89_15395 [Halobacteriota archaeon]